MRNLELPGRSTVYATGGMAATSHVLATQTAIAILRDGGNAIDAAVAACAVQCVVEPQSTGIGGDCFALIAPGGSGDIVAFNGSGRAPAAAEAQWFIDNGITKIERTTPHAVTIPGAIDAWSRMIADYGRMPFGKVLEPAIRYAHDGYPVYSRVRRDFAAQAEFALTDPNTARTFLPGGNPPSEGQLLKQPELAVTLSLIAANGRDAFYTGVVAEDIVGRLKELGGLHCMEDFAEHAGEYVTPIKTTYRGNDIYECPPNGAGVTALILLNILSGFDMAGMGPLSVERAHVVIEAARLAFGDRNAYVADPAMAEIPLQALLSEAHAAELRSHISFDKAMDGLPKPFLPTHADTVYLTVVDSDRNAVSFINSLFNPFGSCIMGPKSGVTLQNRGCGFVVEPGHPNCIAPRKRPMHTIIPGMMVREGRAVMPFGVMGGYYQPVGHAWLLSNLLDVGLDMQEAVDLARLSPTVDGKVEIECGFPAEVGEGLRKLGHDIIDPVQPIGGGQAIAIDWESGVLSAGSEPRKDGCAIGY